jgi:hypothetical protein
MKLTFFCVKIPVLTKRKMSFITFKCNNLMSRCDFNAIHVTIHTTYCKFEWMKSQNLSHTCVMNHSLLCETNHILLWLVTKPNVIFYPLKQLSTCCTFGITFIFQIKMNITLEKITSNLTHQMTTKKGVYLWVKAY